jgi:hypothetical protein
MADRLLEEVDEALRADRAGALWAKYRSTIIWCVVALIVGTAGNSIWQHYRESRGGEVMGQLNANQQLFAQGKNKEAADGFGKIAAERGGELKQIAQVWQARALVAADDKAAATAVLKEASNGTNIWSDIACLRLAGIDANAAKPCLDAAHESPLATERAEWSAANAWAAGDTEGAVKAIEEEIADANTDTDSRAQLTQWLTAIKAQKKSVN